ncbi:glutamate--tRNA ligase [Candidatus Giovannonibacteria bacterium RIFCSPLOWO2_02_FULL_43_11b]|uniref:Glutamate--tRNA ligase n=1 Tax=Candidatus Giovannonibacteria bacterium RIFCSPHIGHO2_12_FULL_43_15 TaxID=1798341 RepID=A0A1F5WPU7_9BACT|nr:MAG: glutamate--tRNA ligase [Candidatus Giovannonibacteria bacterium RIFCSPHIGHO2_01_FULL_43_100]OGF66416.1 MAG: glutamate--tRNA ligase [Candidatus Giovannonibacteria bacterium RIFCSPHIGHO2_02_FULL_43_32]OGF77291.1 MAG: glutamate--tRNA ligase [Candidatus Giovannonibacteria bacterium RIFCSPHIGHO2_12_FULL_43_15]OGF79141.1 MAG: glutamate--tRNA ligase [Candidatus Giovannonibacteria bacterium RIFCSPLOWO2_01_FULL_43_60]OGF90146.1 MAG: glutamate--tRNA ligase [Candidatus Giovannonibacteria bacterium
MRKIRTRLAPSPTGLLHVGNARAGIFNFLFAKKNDGEFILRIEDTDIERSRKEYEENAKEALLWLGLNWDEFYRQSDRKEIYLRHIKRLLGNGSAYVSKEEKGSVIRLKNPGTIISFNDLIRGKIEVDTKDLGDFVIAKNEETPIYHLAAVIDDALMNITHVIRGEDHISNTPRQILIQQALRCPTPKYAHLPLILAHDRSKLSKREGGEALSDYKKMGYPPEAVFNFLALLGWHPAPEQSSVRGRPLEREIFSKEELIEQFSLERVQKGGAIFDKGKLDWISKEYIKKLEEKDFLEKLTPFVPEEWGRENMAGAARLFKDRISKFSDFKREAKFIFELDDYDTGLLIWKNASMEDTKKHLEKVYELVSSGGDVMAYADEVGRGEVLWPLRVALSGLKNSPGPFEIMEVLEKKESLARIKKAIALISWVG